MVKICDYVTLPTFLKPNILFLMLLFVLTPSHQWKMGEKTTGRYHNVQQLAINPPVVSRMHCSPPVFGMAHSINSNPVYIVVVCLFIFICCLFFHFFSMAV